MTLSHLNSLDRAAFIAAIGWVFEHSSWVAERAWSRRPFATVALLHEAMVEEVQAAAPEDRLALLRAHPDLGTRARMSQASSGEQSGAGLDRLTADEFARLQTANAAYRERFGFPFLYAVKGASKYDILKALESRLENTPEVEYEEALRQACRIAQFRLAETVE